MLLVKDPEEASFATAPCSIYACPSCMLTMELPIKAMTGGKGTSKRDAAVTPGAFGLSSEMGVAAWEEAGGENTWVWEGGSLPTGSLPIGFCGIEPAGASAGASGPVSELDSGAEALVEPDKGCPELAIAEPAGPETSPKLESSAGPGAGVDT